MERGRACEGEGGHGEGVRGRRSDVREGESERVNCEREGEIFNGCGAQRTE